MKPPWRALRARSPLRASLVWRLVLLAAAWSLAVIILAGVALSAFFSHAATQRFDNGLSEALDGLVAGASVENAQIIPPTFTDPRSLRVYSGAYWEIATLDDLARDAGLGEGGEDGTCLGPAADEDGARGGLGPVHYEGLNAARDLASFLRVRNLDEGFYLPGRRALAGEQ